MLGVDFPLGLPREYVRRHLDVEKDFPSFLKSLAQRPGFFEVAATLDEVGADRPFYPRRGIKGMTRLSHAQALGFTAAESLSRSCDRATVHRPAGAPLFWTLGANQAGKAAISAWRDLLLPAFQTNHLLSIWPFAGPLHSLVIPGSIVIAETYPADALRQIGLRPIGSKRRQSDRLALVPGIKAAMLGLHSTADTELAALMDCGFGSDTAGEDRMDCLVGVLCVLMVLAGERPDHPPPDPWLTRWEGWVLGQGHERPRAAVQPA